MTSLQRLWAALHVPLYKAREPLTLRIREKRALRTLEVLTVTPLQLEQTRSLSEHRVFRQCKMTTPFCEAMGPP